MAKHKWIWCISHSRPPNPSPPSSHTKSTAPLKQTRTSCWYVGWRFLVMCLLAGCVQLFVYTLYIYICPSSNSPWHAMLLMKRSKFKIHQRQPTVCGSFWSFGCDSGSLVPQPSTAAAPSEPHFNRINHTNTYNPHPYNSCRMSKQFKTAKITPEGTPNMTIRPQSKMIWHSRYNRALLL